jgi:D-methionine transport system permease protein
MLQVASLETLYMVSVSSIVTAIFGIPLGVALVATRKGHILGKIWPVNAVLGATINATRSVPFIIFVVAIIPLTKILVGTSIGPSAVIVPLTLAAIVFMARLAESAILEVPHGVIEAAQSAGATNWQIVRHVLLPEARPGLIQAVTITVINLIGYSAMAGAVGGGGLGDLGIRYGYQRYMWDVMLVTVLILMVWVQVIQSLGDFLAKKFRR